MPHTTAFAGEPKDEQLLALPVLGLIRNACPHPARPGPHPQRMSSEPWSLGHASVQCLRASRCASAMLLLVVLLVPFLASGPLPTCRWVQSECRQLGEGDTPEISPLLKAAAHSLKERPMLFKYCTEEVGSAAPPRHDRLDELPPWHHRSLNHATLPFWRAKLMTSLNPRHLRHDMLLRLSFLAGGAGCQHAALCAAATLHCGLDAGRARGHATAHRSACT